MNAKALVVTVAVTTFAILGGAGLGLLLFGSLSLAEQLRDILREWGKR